MIPSRLLDRLNRLFDEHKGAWAQVGLTIFLVSLIAAWRDFGWTAAVMYVLPASVGYRMVGRWIDEETG